MTAVSEKKKDFGDFIVKHPTIFYIVISAAIDAVMSLIACALFKRYTTVSFTKTFVYIYGILFAPGILHEVICFFVKSFRSDSHSATKAYILYYTPFIMYYIAENSLYFAAAAAFVLMAIIIFKGYASNTENEN